MMRDFGSEVFQVRNTDDARNELPTLAVESDTNDSVTSAVKRMENEEAAGLCKPFESCSHGCEPRPGMEVANQPAVHRTVGSHTGSSQ